MNTLQEIGMAVRGRRTQMGLTQAALAALSGLSRQTISQLESGSIMDLSLQRTQKLVEVLGLSLQVSSPDPQRATAKPKMTPLGKAARTASVSFREPLTPARLRKVLLSGHASPRDQPYVHALLDDAPTSLLAALAHQLEGDAGSSASVWLNYRMLASQVKSRRELWR